MLLLLLGRPPSSCTLLDFLLFCHNINSGMIATTSTPHAIRIAIDATNPNRGIMYHGSFLLLTATSICNPVGTVVAEKVGVLVGICMAGAPLDTRISVGTWV